MTVVRSRPAPGDTGEPPLASAPALDAGAVARALDADRVEARLQPIARVGDGTVVGFEALARLRDDAGALVAPDRFVPTAEASGLILDLGCRVLRRACRDLAALRRVYGRHLSVAVNLSAVQAADPGLAATVRAALDEARLPPDALALELTETALFGGDPDTAETLSALARDGVRIVLDDFGTGWSSLAYLARFPVSALKIDRTFVAAMVADPGRSGAIVQAVVGLAHTLGLDAVAEGVETEAQRTFLRAYRCERMQGYLVAPPLSAADATRFLDRAARATA